MRLRARIVLESSGSSDPQARLRLCPAHLIAFRSSRRPGPPGRSARAVCANRTSPAASPRCRAARRSSPFRSRRPHREPLNVPRVVPTLSARILSTAPNSLPFRLGALAPIPLPAASPLWCHVDCTQIRTAKNPARFTERSVAARRHGAKGYEGETAKSVDERRSGKEEEGGGGGRTQSRLRAAVLCPNAFRAMGGQMRLSGVCWARVRRPRGQVGTAEEEERKKTRTGRKSGEEREQMRKRWDGVRVVPETSLRKGSERKGREWPKKRLRQRF